MKNKINIHTPYIPRCYNLQELFTYYDIYIKFYPKTVYNILIKEK